MAELPPDDGIQVDARLLDAVQVLGKKLDRVEAERDEARRERDKLRAMIDDHVNASIFHTSMTTVRAAGMPGIYRTHLEAEMAYREKHGFPLPPTPTKDHPDV